MGFRRRLDKLFDFLLPQHLVCHACDREAVVNDYGICKACEESLELYYDIDHIQGLDGYTTGLRYVGVAREAMLSLKLNGTLYKKEFLVHHIKLPTDWDFDYVIPVPLHAKRERERGYNQSEVIANEICKRYNLSMGKGFLIRRIDTVRQTGLSAEQRRKNLSNAFYASEKCIGKSFLLVDDVKTTGSTLRECAAELKRQGAVRVYAVTACAGYFAKEG